MENDRVGVVTSMTEHNGINVSDVAIGTKPQFMLEEEYNSLLLECAINGVVDVCRKVGKTEAKKYSEYICNMVKAKLSEC